MRFYRQPLSFVSGSTCLFKFAPSNSCEFTGESNQLGWSSGRKIGDLGQQLKTVLVMLRTAGDNGHTRGVGGKVPE